MQGKYMKKSGFTVEQHNRGTSLDSSNCSLETDGINGPKLRKTFVWYQRLTLPMCEEITISNHQQERPTDFDAQFSRCRALLHFIACRVLGGPERAEDAVENCWRTASQDTPKFDYEGAFRSWLLRVLIDEAIAIVRKNNEPNRHGAKKKTRA
jgi:hypothetical protein